MDKPWPLPTWTLSPPWYSELIERLAKSDVTWWDAGIRVPILITHRRLISYHVHQLLWWMAPLIRIVHAMVAVNLKMTHSAANLTRGSIGWRILILTCRVGDLVLRCGVVIPSTIRPTATFVATPIIGRASLISAIGGVSWGNECGRWFSQRGRGRSFFQIQFFTYKKSVLTHLRLLDQPLIEY